MSVRVRFAPSPTGNLHVGSARTALFNWLFARHENGTFILRIEDTDQKRSNSAFLDDIYAGLEYLGIKADEGPVFQSERFEIYREYARKLVEAGKAVEEEGAVIMPVERREVVFEDMLRGTLRVESDLFERLVLMKSDGTPAYNFACVVDDALMKITHVIRGDDHIANTPKQIVIYEALGFHPPIYVHIPLIVAADRSRLSKRHGATSVSEYRNAGYLEEGFVNYIALLGWSPGGNREFMSPQELIDAFDLKRVKKTAAQFDLRKLDWLNGQHIKKLDPDVLTERLARRLQNAGLLGQDYDKAWLRRITDLIQQRAKTLNAIETEHRFFFMDTPEYDAEAVSKFLKAEGLEERLAGARERLAAVEPFETGAIEEVVRAYIEERQLSTQDLIHPLRVAVTGRAVSPPLFEVLSILGKERALRRIDHVLREVVKA